MGTITAFYPPGDEAWAGGWDGGGGGGGGGGNGFGGGLAGSANGNTAWRYQDDKYGSFWNPPPEGMGGGGGQGWLYLAYQGNALTQDYFIDTSGTSYGLGYYGVGGNAGTRSGGPATAGNPGYVSIKITNLMSDGNFPS
jgi:hypothetical protein